ncbi:MAG: hypothetical protein A2845_04895 [Candidatus Lloydbacteria bacterium RIFCSPHIGHO2_01_FULL_49_22]|uniref:Uncharacterized protein n=1 Tax=Candidatus Lloydbacteria bacterium RIFCSPHIGHO2_01_FULL_49_22 TaxID=1798658 RepID=A0A1G2CWD6_9BACT|nr:MAG: hypothetical protein A2845_04895 [Candidatus Lloydbacteria bacterium RIFCSPHIGHO2_01_FULL_49_22]OGZ10148.1 MAG: hypothetical protein A3C14_00930 [Candidatus Lloydbacteria bacterium RIFCSPHIGHO2_02_FULL_50_18]
MSKLFWANFFQMVFKLFQWIIFLGPLILGIIAGPICANLMAPEDLMSVSLYVFFGSTIGVWFIIFLVDKYYLKDEDGGLVIIWLWFIVGGVLFEITLWGTHFLFQ